MDIQTMKQLGFQESEVQKMQLKTSPYSKNNLAKNLDELRLHPPHYVIAATNRNFQFTIDNKTTQVCHKNEHKLMSLFMYKKLEFDPSGNRCLSPSKHVFSSVYKPYYGQDLSGKTLFVWRHGGIGDLCFIQPILRHLKSKYPTCKIFFSCGLQYFDFVNNWPYIDRFCTMPVDYSTFSSCDYHLSFEGVIERCEEAETQNCYRLFSRWAGLNIEDVDLVPKLFTKSKCNKEILSYLESLGIEPYTYVVVQPRCSCLLRTPPVNLYLSLCYPLLMEGIKIVFCDKPNLHNMIDTFISDAVPKELQHLVFNFCNTSKGLDYATSIINFSRMVIAPDSSMVHISAGLETPVLGIYGPFHGRLRMDTYKHAEWVEPTKDSNSYNCPYGGSGCCLHTSQPCPVASSDHISPCFNHINLQDCLKKIVSLYKVREGFKHDSI